MIVLCLSAQSAWADAVPQGVRFPEGRLPPIDAPASAYGDDVRADTHGRPNLDDLAGIAERERQAGRPALALQLAQRVLEIAPQQAQARQTQISSLANLGAYRRAEALRQQVRPEWPATTRERFQGDAVAGGIRHAVQEQSRQERQQRYGSRDIALSHSLAELDALLSTPNLSAGARQRARFDRLVVLSQLRRYAEVTAEYEALEQASIRVPTYAEAAVADAYLQQRQPERAAERYRAVLNANPEAPLAVRTGYYYALVESEDYDAAAEVLAWLDRNTPTWRSRANPRTPPVPNWERSEVDRLRVLDATYRRHEDEALQQASTLYRQAPRNTDVINGLATTQRARGWYEQAQRTTELAAAYAPRDLATRLNVAENAQDLEDYPRWGGTIDSLASQFPQDSAVRRNRLEWQDRQRFSIEGEGTFGRSRGGDAVNGNRDREYSLRLNSPWSEQGYRVYAEQRYQWSDYEEGAESHDRQGVGVERQWRRKHLWAAVSGDRLHDDVGLELGWSQWLDDHWQYQLRTETQSIQTPLRAEREDLDGRRYEAAVTWRQNESREATLSLGALDISDGNLRSDIGFDLTQRIQSSAHHQTRVIGSLSAEHNSQPEADYYNPENLRAAGATLEHDWLTWRRYERAFTQTVSLGAASEWEQGYGSDPGYDATYGHRWQLTRTWAIRYGIGWGSHVYEGEREKRWFGEFGFEGMF